MYVIGVDRPWAETPFLWRGYPVITQEQIDLARRVCSYVYVDAGEGADRLPGLAVRASGSRAPAAAAPQSGLAQITDGQIRSLRRTSPYAVQSSFQEELPVAHETQAEARTIIDRLFQSVRLGRRIDIEDPIHAVERLAESVIRNPDTLIWLTHLKKRDDYTAIHSLNVCIFLLALGRHLGLAEDALLELGLGGLLHDLGKLLIAEEILNKQGTLTEREMVLVHRHPSFGIGIVQESQGIPRGAVEVIFSHHERINGSGYPQGLGGRAIPLFARMAALVDVYDAVTSDRAYQHAEPSSTVLQMLYQSREELFDASLVERFIQCVGVYPIGSLVELNTGEVGIVTAANPGQRLRPTVSLIRNRRKSPYFPPRVVNLAHSANSAGNEHHGIARILEPGAYGIDMHRCLLEEVPPYVTGTGG